jgi:hypothetical protein
MIELPRRSVTRFFIPLVDVLTLMFCVFLIMQAVRGPEEVGGGEPEEELPTQTLPDLAQRLDERRQELERLRKAQEKERQQLEDLRKSESALLRQRYAFHLLEIEASNGSLYAYDPPRRIPITSKAEARALIERHRREAGGRELYYVFMFPRQSSGYPEQGQIRLYTDWFAEVAHAFENQRGGR